jgi:hypothetical protein
MFIVAIAFNSFFTTVIASEKPEYPFGTYLVNPSTKSYDVIFVECIEIDTLEIECSFVQTMIRRKALPHESEKEFLTAWHKEMNKLKPGEREKALSDLTNDLCSDDAKKKLQQEIQIYKEYVDKEELESISRDYQSIQKVCNNKTSEGLRDFAKSLDVLAAKTCTMFINPWKERFKYQEQSGKWLSQNDPVGPCGTLNISTLSKEKDRKLLVEWTYETRKVVTNKDAEGFPSCKLLDETPSKYVSLPPTKYMNCVYFEP